MTVSPYEPPVGGGEIERYRPEGRDVRRLRDWAEAATAAHRVASMLVTTSFVPVQYKGKPDEAAAAILAGFELGFEPIASLSAFSPIQGRAAPNARTLMAVVLSKGHEMELIESTAARCIMRGRRRGAETWQTVTFTMEQARALGVAQRNPEYRKQPATMLIARCTGQLARLIAPDAIMGIAYSSEELVDADAAATDAATDAPAPPVRRRRETAVRPETPEGSSAQTVDNGRTADGRPLLPGERPAPVSEPLRTDDAVSDSTPTEAVTDHDVHGPLVDTLTAEADAARQALEEHADEIVAGMAHDESVNAPDPADVGKLRRRVFALLREVDVGDRNEFATGILGKPVTTYAGMPAEDLEKLIEALERSKNKGTEDGE